MEILEVNLIRFPGNISFSLLIFFLQKEEREGREREREQERER